MTACTKLQKVENKWDVAEDTCDEMEEEYKTMKKEHDDAEREWDMALQQSGTNKDEAVRQVETAQQCAEVELRAQKKLFEQKEAQLTAELAELEKKLKKATDNKNMAITGMNLANTSAAEHEVMIGDL